jgi:hypothetical protein
MAYCGVDGVPDGSGGCTTDNLYAKSDFKNIVVDGMGVTGAAVVEWLDLIVLLIVLGFILGIFVKLGSLFR